MSKSRQGRHARAHEKSAEVASFGRTSLRSCVASRQRLPAQALMRLSLDAEGKLVPCSKGGRGAWISPDREQVLRLEAAPGMASRSLRRTPASAEALLEGLQAEADRAVVRDLERCRRSGLCRTGKKGAEALGPSLLLFAANLGRWSRERARALHPDCPLHALPWDAATLGLQLGQGPRAFVAILPGRPTRRLAESLQRREALGYSPRPMPDPPARGSQTRGQKRGRGGRSGRNGTNGSGPPQEGAGKGESDQNA
jgi:predicted RNA-binding protein YlxR (DUF448 family)